MGACNIIACFWGIIPISIFSWLQNYLRCHDLMLHTSSFINATQLEWRNLPRLWLIGQKGCQSDIMFYQCQPLEKGCRKWPQENGFEVWANWFSQRCKLDEAITLQFLFLNFGEMEDDFHNSDWNFMWKKMLFGNFLMSVANNIYEWALSN